jgi:hypothetical protein
MSHPVYTVFAGDVLPIYFSTYAGATGASVTLTGLAVTDIEIYKDASMTQRASDAGYTLIDTDGIDIDSITGIHGFTIDTGDNTDASFYTTGAWFTVVVSAVTVDSQTVNFIAAQFRIVPAESSAGVPKVDVSHNAGTAITSASGIQEVKVASIAANAITATSIASDAITAAKVADGTIDAGTFAAGAIDAAAIAANAIGASELASDAVAEIADGIWDEASSGHTTSGTYGDKFGAHLPAILKGLTTSGSTTTTVVMNATTGLDGGVPSATDDFYNGCVLIFTSGTMAGQRTSVTDYVGSTQTLTVTALTGSAASGVTFILV